MILKIDENSRNLFAVKANYLVIHQLLGVPRIIGAYITKKEAIAQNRMYNETDFDNSNSTADAAI